jgi:hypothetical protein
MMRKKRSCSCATLQQGDLTSFYATNQVGHDIATIAYIQLQLTNFLTILLCKGNLQVYDENAIT